MHTKKKWRLMMVPMLLAAAMSWGSARAQEIPLVTGEQWTRSTEQLKRVYLIGLANVMQVETAYHAGNAPPDSQSLIPRAVRGLRGQTLDTVRDGLDRWYAAHPDQLQRPIVETLWFEMVVPGLSK